MHVGAKFCAVCFVIMFFFMEETIYFRDNAVEGEEAAPIEEATVAEKDIDRGSAKTGSAATASPSSPTLSLSRPAYRDINAGSGRCTLFKALPGRPSNADVLRKAYRPVVMIFRFPTVAWAGFLYGINLAWDNVLNGTASPVLSAAPYNWSAALVGCVYAGPIIGAAFASLWSGNFADWIVLRLARRNKGIREAEHRLWVLLLSGIMSAAGLITWGVGA